MIEPQQALDMDTERYRARVLRVRPRAQNMSIDCPMQRQSRAPTFCDVTNAENLPGYKMPAVTLLFTRNMAFPRTASCMPERLDAGERVGGPLLWLWGRMDRVHESGFWNEGEAKLL